MRKNGSWLSLFGAFLLLPIVSTAAVKVNAKIPAGAQILLRFDAAGILQSQTGKELRQESRQLRVANAFMQALTGSQFDDLTEVWFIGFPKDTGAVVLQGQFSQETMQQRLSQIPTLFMAEVAGSPVAVTFTDEKKGTPQMLAMLDSGTVAVGDEARVRQFIDVVTDKETGLPAADPKLQRFSDAADMLLGTVIVPLHELPDFDPRMALFAQEIWLRGNLAENLSLVLAVYTADSKHAEGLEMILRGLLLMLPSLPEVAENHLLMNILRHSETARDGQRLDIKVELPGVELKKLLPAQ